MKGRLMVAENAIGRHESDISKLWEKVNSMEICISSLPRIEKTLEAMGKSLEELNKCKLVDEGASRQRRTLWDDYRDWIKQAIFIILGAVALFAWQATIHMYGGGAK